MREALLEHGIRLRNYGIGGHKSLCPQCSHLRKNKREPCLSVTIEPDGNAVWKCHNCAWTGTTWTGGMGKREYRKPEIPAERQAGEQMLKWFESERRISRSIVREAGVYSTQRRFGDEVQGCIAFPYFHDGEITNVKYRTRDKRFQQEAETLPTLYGVQWANPEYGPLVFVEGEMDVLACRQASISNAVSLPNGAPQTRNEGDRRYEPLKTHAALLEGFERAIIATDMDGPGEILADELARRLGKDKCWRARFPDGNDTACKDANDTLIHHGPEVLRECIQGAEPWPIDGLHKPEAFFDGVWAEYRGEGHKPLSTGFRTLDLYYRVFPGDFCVITGIPNHGKSNWMDQVMVQMARNLGWRWAVFSPEHRPSRHMIRLAEKFLRMPFADGPFRRMGEGDLQRALVWINERFMVIEPGEHTPSIDWIIERARGAVLRHGVRGVVIDPYNEIEASRPQHQTETEFVSQLISKLKRLGRTHDVAIWMVVHPTKLQREKDGKEPVPNLYDLHGSAHWRNKSDAGIVIHRNFEDKSTEIHIKKIREQPERGQLGIITLRFDVASRCYEEMDDGP